MLTAELEPDEITNFRPSMTSISNDCFFASIIANPKTQYQNTNQHVTKTTPAYRLLFSCLSRRL